MANQARVRLQTDERRAQLLELGRELFNARSYDDISIDDIAAAAGISKGLLYHYFSGKRPFYVETIRASVQELLKLTATADAEADPAAQFQQGLEAYLGYVEQNARGYANLLTSGLGADPEVAALVESTREAMMRRVARGLGVESPRGALQLALRGWIGFVEASAIAWTQQPAGPGKASREALLALFTTVLAASLKSAAKSDEPGEAAPAAPRRPSKRRS